MLQQNTFVRNAWYIASWAEDVQAQPIARRICDIPLVLYRTVRGEPAALLDRCCHRALPLSSGTVTNAGLQCGYHGMVYNTAGTCVEIPGQGHVPSAARVRSFPVVEKDALLWVWMGDPARADPATIIDYPFHGASANWPNRHATIGIRAGYMLVVDNLMDPSHVAYVHRATIGGSEDVHMNAKTETERTPRGLKFTRWILDHKAPPVIAKAFPFAGNINRWQEFEYVAPSVVKQWAGSFDATIAVSDEARQNAPHVRRIFHGVTPETPTSCFYFWSVAIRAEHGDPGSIEYAFQSASTVFAEDKLVLELQQARITDLGEDGLIDMHTDGARVTMRRTLERLIKEDGPRETLFGRES